MSAPTLNRTVKPLTITLSALLLLSMFSVALAASTVQVNYNLSANRTNSVDRTWTLSGPRGTYMVSESRTDSLDALGAATVTFIERVISANGSIQITREVSGQRLVTVNGTVHGNSTISESETSTINFSGEDSREVLAHFGPLRGHPNGTIEQITINGQTYNAIHVSRSFTNHFTSTVTETLTKTHEGRTYTVSVERSISRDISISADFWFAENSGVLLKSQIQGSITIQASADGSITSPRGTETFSMTATFSESFSRNVEATSISGSV